MHSNPKMLHLIMTLLVHGAYMESTKCPEACSCIETVTASSNKVISLIDLDEVITHKADPDQPGEKYYKYLSGIETIDGLYNLRVFSANNSHKFPQRKKCKEKGEDVKSVFLSSKFFKSLKMSENSDLNSSRTKRTLGMHDKIDFYETNQNIGESENTSATTKRPSANEENKNAFTYQITCVELRDLKSVWIQDLPAPATELNIQKTKFQSFKAFQEILKESSIGLSQLTVLSVSDSIINQSSDKSYPVKTESTNKRETVEKGKHSEFLPFASLQNPKPRSNSETKFPSDGKSKNLQVLNLTNSTIPYLPQHMFHPFINLQILNLSNNLIEYIENETFGTLVNLLHLDIHNNRLRSLNEIMFKNLSKLIFLDVSRNLLSNIEPITFQYLSSLNVLSLGSNPLSEKQEAVVLLGTGKRLQIVDISKAGLKQIPGTLERSVRILNLMGNFLLSIRCGDLDSYSLLSYLNLKSNRISYVEDDALGRLEFLKNLQMSENNLFQIPKILPSKLEILNLSFNNIQNITSSDFLNLSSLKELSLSYNQVSSIEKNVFNSLVHLKLLDISRNPILVLPAISGRIKLVVLNLSYFTNIPDNYNARYAPFPVQWPQSIKHLNLESSPILTKTFLQDTKTLESFTSLEELNLRFTNLTTIRKDIFSLLPKLSVLRVEGNPWHCNKEILILSTWLRSHATGEGAEDEDEVNTAHCLTPPQLYKTNLIILGKKNFEEDRGDKSDKLMSAKRTKTVNRGAEILKLHNGSEGKSVNFSESIMAERVKMKGKTGGNITLSLNDNKAGPPNRENYGESSEEKLLPSKKDSTSAYASPSERVSSLSTSSHSSSEEDLAEWSSASTESLVKIKNSLDLKSRQVSLLALKKAEAVTSKDTISLEKESNSHQSFLILSSIGLVFMASLTFISLYFTRTRRDQSYQRQNQDIEVFSISSLRNELW